MCPAEEPFSDKNVLWDWIIYMMECAFWWWSGPSPPLHLAFSHTDTHTPPPPLPHWPQTPSCASWLALAAPYFCFVFCLFATVQKYFCGIWQDWRVGQQHPTIRAKRSLVFRLVYPRPSIFITQARHGPVSWALRPRFPPHIPPAVTIWALNE